MARFRLVGLLATALIAALALGGLAMFLRETPGSGYVAASAIGFVLVVVCVVAGAAFGSRDRPDDTPYW